MIELSFAHDDFSTNDDMNIEENQKEKDDENTTIMFNLKRKCNNVT